MFLGVEEEPIEAAQNKTSQDEEIPRRGRELGFWKIAFVRIGRGDQHDAAYEYYRTQDGASVTYGAFGDCMDPVRENRRRSGKDQQNTDYDFFTAGDLNFLLPIR